MRDTFVLLTARAEAVEARRRVFGVADDGSVLAEYEEDELRRIRESPDWTLRETARD